MKGPTIKRTLRPRPQSLEKAGWAETLRILMNGVRAIPWQLAIMSKHHRVGRAIVNHNRHSAKMKAKNKAKKKQAYISMKFNRMRTKGKVARRRG